MGVQVKLTYWFTVIRRMTDSGEMEIVEKQMFTDYSHALSFGRPFLCDNPRTTFTIYARPFLPSSLQDWAVEQIRDFHSKRIGDIIL